MTARLLALNGRNSSLLLEVADDGLPVWRHWGARLDADPAPPPWLASMPVATSSLDRNQPLRVFPLFGRGWFGPGGLQAHRDQLGWAPSNGPCGCEASDTRITCTLADTQSGLLLVHTLGIEPESDVLTLRTTLTNTGNNPLDVAWLAAGALPLPPTIDTIESFSGRHNHEFQRLSDAPSRSGWRRENRRGLTSHDCPPMACILGRGAGQNTGPVWAAQLAWSGNHVQSIDWLDDGRWLWMAGEWLAPGEVRLAPGETLATPDWLATYSPHGRDGAAQNFHAAIRQRSPLSRSVPPKPRLVHINTWEGFYFNHDEAALMDLATAAAELGIERFVLDDGWFAGRKDDTAALGDWRADPVKYPDGLAPLANHVRGLGMEFGLWVEPEMVNPDSDLYRTHPDWALRLGPGEPLTARNQLVLDLSRGDVQAYLLATLDELLTRLPISYLKWDHNRDLTEAGSSGKPAYRRQVLCAYALIDALRTRHPGVEIEACAGGGGRIDAGILTRTDRVWTSDCIDAVSRSAIQAGFLGFFPPEIMGAHVGASPAHSTGRSQSLAFRAAVALPGHFGVELDPRRLSACDRTDLAEWIATYKSVRARLHSGKVWQGHSGDGVTWQAHGTPDDFILLIYRLEPTSQRFPPPVQLPFVDPQSTYGLHRIDPRRGRHDAPPPQAVLAMDEGLLFLQGSWLSQVGLPLPFMKAETALVLQVTAQRP